MKIWNLLFIGVLTGCVSAPNGETARITSNANFVDTVKIIDDYTNTCWTKAASLSNDQIITKKTINPKNVQYVLGRDNSDIPFMPFANIYVLNRDGVVEISIEEGAVSMTEPWGVDTKLNKWLSGDKSCT